MNLSRKKTLCYIAFYNGTVDAGMIVPFKATIYLVMKTFHIQMLLLEPIFILYVAPSPPISTLPLHW